MNSNEIAFLCDFRRGSILGLVAALLGDGALDMLSSLALGAIVVLICGILRPSRSNG